MTLTIALTITVMFLVATVFCLALGRAASKPAPFEMHGDDDADMGLAPVSEWTTDERRIWRTFLYSPVGKSLMIRARHVEATMSIKACADAFTTTHSAAQASGFSECLKWLESLAVEQTISGASAVQDANHSTTAEQDDGQPVAIRRSF